jgi:hypothetical protein
MATPPKRNYGPKRGLKKTRPTFRDETSAPQSGLGPAYNSTKDPRGPDAYVPVPPNPTQRKGPRGRSYQDKVPMGGYGPGSQFLMYDRPSSPQKMTTTKKARRKTGDQWIG